MESILSPIVGAFYRPPAKTILSMLKGGHELHLDPEPGNPYDENAVRVIVKLNSIDLVSADMEAVEEELMKYGSTWADLHKDEFGFPVDDPWFHLGYIPRSGAKTAMIDGQPSPGNLEVLDILKDPDHTANLAFSPAGQPVVLITVAAL